MDYLVIGLGNPSPQYDGTRHNTGSEAVGRWAAAIFREAGETVSSVRMLPCPISIPHFRGHASMLTFSGANIIVCVDLGTYMNESGEAVATLLNYKKILPEKLVVVHDELALPLGRIRVDRNSSAAGHNGVQSIIDALGTQDFIRIRLGIETRPNHDIPGETFVLQRFTPMEATEMQRLYDRAAAALASLLIIGLERTMSEFNRDSD